MVRSTSLERMAKWWRPLPAEADRSPGGRRYLVLSSSHSALRSTSLPWVVIGQLLSSANQDGHTGVRATADHVGEGDPGPLHLACAGRTPQLSHQLDDLTERGRAERFAFREKATRRVDRPFPSDPRAPVCQDRPLLARRAETELGPGDQLARRVGVLALDDVDVVGTEPRHFAGVLGRERSRWRDVG